MIKETKKFKNISSGTSILKVCGITHSFKAGEVKEITFSKNDNLLYPKKCFEILPKENTVNKHTVETKKETKPKKVDKQVVKETTSEEPKEPKETKKRSTRAKKAPKAKK